VLVRKLVDVENCWLVAVGMEATARIIIRINRTAEQIALAGFGITGFDQPTTILIETA
jgi:hypothetical protein